MKYTNQPCEVVQGKTQKEWQEKSSEFEMGDNQICAWYRDWLYGQPYFHLVAECHHINPSVGVDYLQCRDRVLNDRAGLPRVDR
jgi:hypothetical protein